MPYINRPQIIDAISRFCFFEGRGNQIDGTYRLIPTWIGSERVWMAERIEETSGFEVAFDEIKSDTDLYVNNDFDRVGIWQDETGYVWVDRTMHIRGTLSGVAHDVARLYNQKAIWSWHRGEVETVDPTCTALPV